MELAGKRLIIVGAGSGIGRSVAVAASQAGAEVVLASRRRETLEATAKLAGARTEIHPLDATVEAAVEAFFEQVGPFDHLVGTLGQTVAGAVQTLAAEDVQRAVAAKLWAPFFLVKHGAPRISPEGSFTFFSGIRGNRPAANGAITSLVNGGLEAFARAMAVELGPVRVNVISPGVVDSGPFWSRLGAEKQAQMFADFAARSPARRVGRPDELAQAALFAMGNPFLTGAVLPVDGGALLM